MRMFLLQSVAECAECHMRTLVIFRATSDLEARELAFRSNSHGQHVTDIDWRSLAQAVCIELPLLDGPKGIVVGSHFEMVQPC